MKKSNNWRIQKKMPKLQVMNNKKKQNIEKINLNKIISENDKIIGKRTKKLR